MLAANGMARARLRFIEEAHSNGTELRQSDILHGIALAQDMNEHKLAAQLKKLSPPRAVEKLIFPSPPLAMRLGKDPKVALCLSGQLRNFEEGSSNIKSHICNQYDTTVFVSCWDTRGFKLTGFEYMRRLLPPHLADKFPEKYVGPKFANYFPKSVALLKDLAMSPVTKADVTKVYKDAIIQVIKEADFERTYLTESLRKAYVNREYILSQFKMYRQIHSATTAKAIRKGEVGTFDVVIRPTQHQFAERLSILTNSDMMSC